MKVGNCDNGIQLLWVCWGLDWIITPPSPDGDIQKGNPYRSTGAMVCNMSMFIDSANPWDHVTPITSMENEVNNLVRAGVTVVVSANNQANSNCTTSPARLAYGNAANYPSYYHVISVGGTDELDHLWRCTDWNECAPPPQVENDPGSNTGACVDIYAPAHSVKVAWYGLDQLNNPVDYRRAGQPSSGTSFAAPLVAGIAARILQTYPWWLPDQVWSQIQAQSIALPANFDGDSISTNDRIAHMDSAQ